MGKKKVEKFTNFNYEVNVSKDAKYADVKCSFKYQGKNVQHYVSFVKQSGASNAKYIEDAKKKIEVLKANGKLEKFAKKYISRSTPNSLRRFKKPLLITAAAVLVAGIAVGATFLALKFINGGTNKSNVTEKEIDEYLKTPNGTVNPIDFIVVQSIAKQAEENVEKLNGLEVKNLSSFPYYTASDNEKRGPNSSFGAFQGLADRCNDLTGVFVSNKTMQNKDVYGTYLDIDLKKDKEEIPCWTISATDTNTKVISGNTFTTKVTTDQTYLAKKTQSQGEEQSFYDYFAKSKINYQDLIMPESYRLDKFPTKENAIEAMNQTKNKTISEYTNNAALQHALEGRATFYADNKGTVYYREIYESEGEDLPISEEFSVKTIIRTVNIWRFTKNKQYGWVLDSYACDGRPIYGKTVNPASNPGDESIYVETNEHGEKLKKPFAINKMKGFVKLKYGDIKSLDTSKIEYNDDESVWSYRTVDINVKTETNDSIVINKIKDITPYHRADDPTFKGFKFYGSYVFDAGAQIYLTVNQPRESKEEPIKITYEKLTTIPTFIVKGEEIESEKHYMQFTETVTCYFDVTLKKDGSFDSLTLTKGRK